MLPLRVWPIAGEAIDSWLEMTAYRLQLPLGLVIRKLDLPAATHPAWILWLSEGQSRAIAAATGILPATAHAMTLAAYDGVALQLDAESHCLVRTFPYRPLTWSRYCPECLGVSQGRWQLAWRFGWSFACTAHGRLLADSCPRCDARQRRQYSYSEIPTPTLCKCGYDLSCTATPGFSRNHPIVAAQHRVDRVLYGPNEAFGIFTPPLEPPRTVLETLRSLSNRVLNYASTHGLGAVAAAELHRCGDAELLTLRPDRAPSALKRKAPTTAIETAVGVTGAINIVNAATVTEAGYRARWLIEGQIRDTGPAELRSCRRDTQIATAIMIRASDVYMGPELQLKYRSAITMPRAPDRYQDGARAVAAALPSAMWSEWSAHLLRDLRETSALRSALSIMTVVIGSAVRPVEAARMLGERTTEDALTQCLSVLRSSQYWRGMCAGLIRLSDYLNETQGPIDYGRRRQLDYSTILSGPDWKTIARRMGTLPRDENTRLSGRCYLVERLTGRPSAAPGLAAQSFADRAATRSTIGFRQQAGPGQLKILNEYAQEFLAWHRIDEPVTWCPPLGLLAGLGLPEPDPLGADSAPSAHELRTDAGGTGRKCR
jgi:hypothetical protein